MQNEISDPRPDLWELAKQRQTETLCKEIEDNFYERCPPDKRPVHYHEHDSEDLRSRSPSGTYKGDEDIDEKVVSPDPNKTADLESSLEGKTTASTTQQSAKAKPKYDSSLVRALHKTFFWRFWAAGLLKLFSGSGLSLCVARSVADD